jgi:hypothetical protein
MKIIVAALLLLVFVAAGTGCNRLRPLLAPEPRWTPAAEETVLVPQEKQDVLAYFNYIEALSEAELGGEFGVVKQRFASTHDEEDRWRLIFLSILPGQPFSDRDYAFELLRGSKPEPSPEIAPRASLGRLLSMLLADQRELKRKLSEEKQRAEQLAQQMQELKEIEKILSEREKKRPAGK